jgi:hypothetical protein
MSGESWRDGSAVVSGWHHDQWVECFIKKPIPANAIHNPEIRSIRDGSAL